MPFYVHELFQDYLSKNILHLQKENYGKTVTTQNMKLNQPFY